MEMSRTKQKGYQTTDGVYSKQMANMVSEEDEGHSSTVVMTLTEQADFSG